MSGAAIGMDAGHTCGHRLCGMLSVLLAALPAVVCGGAPAGPVDPGGVAGFWTREHKAVALNAGIVGAAAAYGFSTWGWGESSFATHNEGWFGADTRSGGADKLGHAYTASVATAVGAALYRRWGYAEHDAARLGAFSGLLLTAAIEVGDGFSPEHGFSWEDQVANVAGVGFEYLRLRQPALRHRVQFRWEYYPSEAVRNGEQTDILTDYSGSRWLFAFPLRAWGANASALRWIELQAGYGTRGFASSDRPYSTRPSGTRSSASASTCRWWRNRWACRAAPGASSSTSRSPGRRCRCRPERTGAGRPSVASPRQAPRRAQMNRQTSASLATGRK